LRVGFPAFLKLFGSLKIVTVIFDDGVNVGYTYPLRPLDKTVHTIPKAHIYVPLASLRDELSLGLSYTKNHFIKDQFGHASFIRPNSLYSQK
jgi:hypothetical protein